MAGTTNGKDKRDMYRLSQSDAFKVLKLIEEHGKMNEATGYFEYETGWDDNRICREIMTDENYLQAVVYRRMEVFGKVMRPKYGKDNDVEALEVRINTLETDNRALRVKLYEQAKRVEACEKGLNIFFTAPIQELFKDESMKKKFKDLKEHFAHPAQPAERPGAGF